MKWIIEVPQDADAGMSPFTATFDDGWEDLDPEEIDNVREHVRVMLADYYDDGGVRVFTEEEMNKMTQENQ